MKKKLLGILLIILSIFTISNVYAEDKEVKTYDGFKAIAGDKITLEENINGSAAIAGETIDLKSYINGNAFIASNTINLTGKIENAFLAGNTINIKGNIEKDAFIAANYVTISKDATLSRDSYIAAANIDISGNIERNISVAGEIVNINDANIKGNVTIIASEIIIGNNVTIDGTLKYNENIKSTIGEEATINNVEKIAIETQEKNDTTSYIKSLIYSIVGLLVVFVVLQTIAPNLFNNISKTTQEKKNITNILFAGLASIILIPIISAVLMITTFGFSLSILLLTTYFVIMYLSTILSGYVLGEVIYQKLFNKNDNPYAIGAIGIIILTLLKLIPYLGGLINLITISLGFGIVIYLIKNIKR